MKPVNVIVGRKKKMAKTSDKIKIYQNCPSTQKFFSFKGVKL